jgi:agmatinase
MSKLSRPEKTSSKKPSTVRSSGRSSVVAASRQRKLAQLESSSRGSSGGKPFESSSRGSSSAKHLESSSRKSSGKNVKRKRATDGVASKKSLFGAKSSFDPDAAALETSGIFGLPHAPERARVHVIPVPFDATTSYRKGTARGPEAILRASKQVDLFDLATGKPYEHGIAMLDPDPRIARLNDEASQKADRVIQVAGVIGNDEALKSALERVNVIGAELNRIVEASVDAALADGRLPVIVGGDHSTPFGAMKACAARHPGLGVLHFDAHADLRSAYEGFDWSHASIMDNVVKRIDGVAKLVQVGIRDVGERELERIERSQGRIRALFDKDWQRAKFDGPSLRKLARSTIEELPDVVYVSFDIDGLDPTLCPNTGTPVPGGLSWSEAMLWLEELARSKKRIVGLDLNEVSPGATSPKIDSWDAIVGARLLYRMIGTALASG